MPVIAPSFQPTAPLPQADSDTLERKRDAPGNGRSACATRRPPGKPLAGKWEFPGGKLESGESAREAIAREVHEELDLEVLSARLILTYFHQYPDQWIRFTCFRIRVFDASRAKPQASTAIEWIAPNAIDPARFPAGSAPLIQRLRELRPR